MPSLVGKLGKAVRAPIAVGLEVARASSIRKELSLRPHSHWGSDYTVLLALSNDLKSNIQVSVLAARHLCCVFFISN
jgi:hypothetical protein